MLNMEPLEAAAKTLVSGQGESLLARAGIILTHMKHAVETIIGKEVEVLKRMSKSTGEERLAFIMGKTIVGAREMSWMSNVSPTRLRCWKDQRKWLTIYPRGG